MDGAEGKGRNGAAIESLFDMREQSELHHG
jgi:hypothetical protein